MCLKPLSNFCLVLTYERAPRSKMSCQLVSDCADGKKEILIYPLQNQTSFVGHNSLIFSFSSAAVSHCNGSFLVKHVTLDRHSERHPCPYLLLSNFFQKICEHRQERVLGAREELLVKMSSGKEGKEGKEATIAKAAGAAIAVGVAWGIFRFVKAKKEEDALIQEYYGDREDFTIPGGDKNDIDVDEVYIEKDIEFVNVHPPPPPPEFPPHADELKSVSEEEFKATEESQPPKPEPKRDEKPWFLRLFDPPKKNEGKPSFKESESFEFKGREPKESECYQIRRGDTLWGISGKYGIPLDALKAANGLHGDRIYTGEELVIPPK